MTARALALQLLDAALDSVDARASTGRALQRARADGVRLDGCTVFAFGKAARGMTEALLDRARPRAGLVVGPDTSDRLGPLPARRGGHPLPAPDAAEVGREVLELARSLGPDEVALCLISGGGSAMLELPVDGVTIDELRDTTDLLLRAGADIVSFNAVRQALSALKGGRLGAAIRPAAIVNVVLSDVPGADPAVVASGPTLPPPALPDAATVIARLGLREQVPAAVLAALERTRPPVEDHESRTYLAADNATARAAVVAAAAGRGLRIDDLAPGHYLSGEAREAGADFYRRARARAETDRLDGIVFGGETTVRVHGRGRGGRNQEVVLGAVTVYEGGLLLAAGTDGIDGPTDAAGAFVDAGVVGAMRAANLDPQPFLDDNDADAFFAATGGRVVTGPTGTNVADLVLYLPDRR